jgi:hypothetical protein
VIQVGVGMINYEGPQGTGLAFILILDHRVLGQLMLQFPLRKMQLFVKLERLWCLTFGLVF